ncbi:response regulator [Paenibacillus herberti]|uniref:DNA-binding response regulator n=1 Tax=Paenibacillus herberti TaxID=1619309 RepID=A0A229P0N1_9BACL|nr:response regulator [Paenibacillus herberti]OXM15667.1 DNA-binding response regulator [Paenibacillus herberti]
MDITILLVDDEAVDLAWLRVRVEGSGHDSLKIAGTAKSGFAALKLMEQERIDIILSDIRMPIMTGTEFARKAKEINPAVHIVFISGHEDFGYAKEAIQLNAAGYLLKPVADNELNEMIANLCMKVEAEREVNSSVTEAVSLVQREVLLRWFRNPLPEHAEERVQRFLDPLLREGAAVALIEVDDLEYNTKSISIEERRKLLLDVEQFIQEFVHNNRLGVVMTGFDNRYLLLITIEEQICRPVLEKMVGTFGRVFPFTITIGLGRFALVSEGLHDSYGQAESALNTKWILGKNKIIIQDKLAPPTPLLASGLPAEVDLIVDEMLPAMLEYDLVKIDDSLMRLFQQDKDAQPLPKSASYDLIFRMTSKLHADLKHRNENLYELLDWESHMPLVLFEFETIHDLISWLRRRFFEVSEMLFLKQRRQERKLIGDITRYVEERLEFKVTLREVAAHFEFTPNYLGQLFRAETGVAFSDFLNDMRMKRACALLDDPRMKVYEIADRIGYKNIIYFNRQFKQVTGMTPGEYRKKNKI